MSKNNFKERVRKMEPKQERFSIRKFTVGAASVLIGFTFFMNGGQKAQAAEQNASSDNTNQESDKAASDESSSETEQAVSDQQLQNKVNDISDLIDQLKATGGKKSDVQAKAAQIQNQIDALSDAEKTALAAKQGATDSAASTTAADSDKNIARTVTINGNGNTIDFEHYSLMFEDANQKNGSA